MSTRRLLGGLIQCAGPDIIQNNRDNARKELKMAEKHTLTEKVRTTGEDFTPEMKRLSNLIQNRLLDLSQGIGGIEITAARCSFWADSITVTVYQTRPIAAAPELLAALQAQKAAIVELFKEVGNKEAGNWGIINEGLMQADKAIIQATGSAGESE